jgi:hypothetical protein
VSPSKWKIKCKWWKKKQNKQKQKQHTVQSKFLFVYPGLRLNLCHAPHSSTSKNKITIPGNKEWLNVLNVCTLHTSYYLSFPKFKVHILKIYFNFTHAKTKKKKYFNVILANQLFLKYTAYFCIIFFKSIVGETPVRLWRSSHGVQRKFRTL